MMTEPAGCPLTRETIHTATTAPLRLCEELWLPVERVLLFGYISDHGRIQEWFPLVHSVRLWTEEVGDATCAMRCCTLVNGTIMVERLLPFAEPWIFGYAIHADNPFGLRNHLATVEVRAEAMDGVVGGEAGSRLIWCQYFDHADAATMSRKLSANVQAAFVNLRTRFELS